jgi:hypothetical protein
MKRIPIHAALAVAWGSITLLLLSVFSLHAQNVTPLRIMCVGDGNTVGYTDNPKWTQPFEFGFRSGLYTRLINNGYAVQFVGDSPEPWNGNFGLPTNTPSPDLRTVNQDHHWGYAGLDTTGVLVNIGSWVNADDPDVVLLLVGIDDTNLVVASSNLNGIVETIVTNKPLTDVIVAQVTPVVHYSQFIVDLNTFIRGTLVPSYQTQGKHVSTVDQYTNLLTNGTIDPALFSNGVNHPNAIAFDRMAQTWFAGIQAVRQPPFQVKFTSLTVSAGNFVLTGTGGPANGNFQLLSTTNPALPLWNWSINGKGTFDNFGEFTSSAAVPSEVPKLFFRLQIR